MMSLMTENLLLHAQSLREEGELDASIDLLRVVISQCNSDAQKEKEENIRHRVANGSSSVISDNLYAETTIEKLLQTAAYQLALLLLQRSGRQRSNSLGDIDEKEADNLLWKLGYRLRLTKIAFGYPRCNCFSTNNNHQLTQVETSCSENRCAVSVIDNLLPASIFDAAQHAFRSGSRYWSEFYTSGDHCDQGELSKTIDNQSTQRTSHFASHNIRLRNEASSTTRPISEKLQSSKSLLEQVAIIAQHRLQERFPDIRKATSVEMWSHRRSSDGHHQLHYDMDEIRLWKHRLEERDKKRRKIDADTEIAKLETKHRQDRFQESGTDGISCPMVSCVLTINVPGESNCRLCRTTENSAPTIICNQSIMSGNGSNRGYLCFPIPNRLLAFEGSLLHGVMPGIPFMHTSSIASSEESDGSCNDAGEDIKTDIVNNYRITLMMGFWETVTTMPTSSIITEKRGPNVPFDAIQHDNTWTDEFKPHSVTSCDIAAVTAGDSQESKHVVKLLDLHPLWVPVSNIETRNSFGEYTAGNARKLHGRFFLTSTTSTQIDNEVLNGECL